MPLAALRSHGWSTVSRDLRDAIARVVAADNCSGCGACALMDERVTMEQTLEGFNRPSMRSEPRPSTDREAQRVRLFNAVCPGVAVTAPTGPAAGRDPLFGPYVSVWKAQATSSEIRFAGSSGGVLTALGNWLLATGRTRSVVAARAVPGAPTESESVTLLQADQVRGSAGSRYAPVSTAANPDVLRGDGAVVAKPCEAAALRAWQAHEGVEDGPLLLSFFCAGVPSQLATDQLVRDLGGSPGSTVALRYRGNGWPGRFVATDSSGREYSCSYPESWGLALGPTMQWRCKICVDGVGELADIVAGDYWETDPRGYPRFEEADGYSVVIARTPRGERVLSAAITAGVIAAERVPIESLHQNQPHQAQRRATLAGRLIGVRATGRVVPTYRGFGLGRLALAAPIRNMRAAAGSAVRQVRARRTRQLRQA